MTAIQQWFFETIKTDTHHFNQAFILSSQDSLDTAILEQSLVAIIKHHDLLRATYPLEEGNLIQTIHPESPLDFQIVNLKETTQSSAVIERYANETQASFDLTKGPLVKAILFKKETQDELLLVIHHLVVDGVSWRIILEDLTTAYQQLATAKSVKLPLKTAPFTWWSKQISDYANSEASLQHQAYWSQVLNQSVDQLIIDYPEQPNTVGDSATVSVQLNAKETQSLLKATNKAYNTEINDVLLCALSRALQQTFGGTSYQITFCLLYTSPSPRDATLSRMPSSA